MKNKITLIHTGGPYGDACSDYKFVLNKEMTLEEFAEMIAEDGKNWGHISTGIFSKTLADYTHGYVSYKPDVYKDAIVAKEGTASGGWSRMDYYVELVWR